MGRRLEEAGPGVVGVGRWSRWASPDPDWKVDLNGPRLSIRTNHSSGRHGRMTWMRWMSALKFHVWKLRQ